MSRVTDISDVASDPRRLAHLIEVITDRVLNTSDLDRDVAVDSLLWIARDKANAVASDAQAAADQAAIAGSVTAPVKITSGVRT